MKNIRVTCLKLSIVRLAHNHSISYVLMVKGDVLHGYIVQVLEHIVHLFDIVMQKGVVPPHSPTS